MRHTAPLLAALLLLLPLSVARAGEEDPAKRAQLASKLRLFVRECLDKADADKEIAALRSLERLRDELDHRRDRALIAIFHPVASALRNASDPTLQALQRIVERRVEAVREVWRDPRVATLSQESGIRETLRYLGRLFQDLERLGDEAPRLRAHAGVLPLYWYRREITVRDFYWTHEEETRQDYDAWVVGFYNEAHIADCSAEAREQIRLLNAYRRMIGYSASVKTDTPIQAGMDEVALLKTLAAATLVDRKPIHALRIDKRLVAAAEGHARGMADGGYFSHMTPEHLGQAGTRSPAERIARAGYGATAMSENIAAGAKTAAQAHALWLLHRTKHQILLGPWSDVGVAHTKDRWVQNFGAGDGGPQKKQPDVKPRRGSG